MRTLLFASVALAFAPAFASAQGDAPEITVLSPGAEPHRRLRHRFEPGITQPIRLRVQSQMRTALGEQINTIPMPIMRMDLTFGPTTVTDEGNLRYPFEITDVGITGGENEALNQRVEAQIRTLVGATGTTEIDPRGTVTEFEYQVPEGAPPELRTQSRLIRDSLSRLLPRFPDQPVGPGARWRVVDDLSLPNMTVRVATTYTLHSWRGDRIELRVRTETLEGAPNPARVDVSGSGRLRFELGTLRVYGRVQTVAAARVIGPQGEVRMRIRTRMQVTPR